MPYDRIGVLQHQLLAGCSVRNDRWLVATLGELEVYEAEGDARAQELAQVLRTVHTWFPPAEPIWRQ